MVVFQDYCIQAARYSVSLASDFTLKNNLINDKITFSPVQMKTLNIHIILLNYLLTLTFHVLYPVSLLEDYQLRQLTTLGMTGNTQNDLIFFF